MIRLLPLPIFICIYLFSWWRCRKNIAASDKQLKPCIDWAKESNTIPYEILCSFNNRLPRVQVD